MALFSLEQKLENGIKQWNHDKYTDQSNPFTTLLANLENNIRGKQDNLKESAMRRSIRKP